jgi:hypothetical protein
LMDGRLVAGALCGIEEAMNGPIAAELDAITAAHTDAAQAA